MIETAFLFFIKIQKKKFGFRFLIFLLFLIFCKNRKIKKEKASLELNLISKKNEIHLFLSPFYFITSVCLNT